MCRLRLKKRNFQTFHSLNYDGGTTASCNMEVLRSFTVTQLPWKQCQHCCSLSWIRPLSLFCLSRLNRFLGLQAAVWEALALNCVIIVRKRWSCRGRLRADSRSLSTDTKLLLMRTTAGDLFSSVLQRTHTQTDKQIHSRLGAHTREENISETQRSEQSRNLWRKTGSRHKTVKYITVVHSKHSLLWKVSTNHGINPDFHFCLLIMSKQLNQL